MTIQVPMLVRDASTKLLCRAIHAAILDPVLPAEEVESIGRIYHVTMQIVNLSQAGLVNPTTSAHARLGDLYLSIERELSRRGKVIDYPTLVCKNHHL